MTMITAQPMDQDDEQALVPHGEVVEGTHLVEAPQHMEVDVQAEAVSTAENQVENETQATKYTWTIKNFSRMNVKKLFSDVFMVGGNKWRVLVFPQGNNVDYLSMYLDVADHATLPNNWTRFTHFSLAVVNQVHSELTVRKEAQHQFHGRESDWGFTSFMPLSELYDIGRGYLVNDTCIIEAEVAVRRMAEYLSYDSKKETGYVGLKNQGATCYMNSLLQTLYHIPYFRKAVYHMPTTENDMPSGSIPLALQSLFYKLQYNETSVSTKELTRSFGWDTYDSFMQHDVQELNRVLCEKLEDKMKGTVVEGTIQKLFEGHNMNYIECINVDFKSTRKESFYDLQLDVKGCKDVYASFDKYVEVERLEGDNKYHAEQHNLQDARKGVLFTDFPPVLELQLKRFEYDYLRDTMVKINDRYEFPLELDLDRDCGKYLSPDADKSVRNLYTLHSVLVHSGGISGGHYYAFIRPTLSDQWFKFDDDRVTKEDLRRALEEQYGGEEELPQTNPGYNNTPLKFTKYSNAYMLVYIRVSDKEKIVCDVNEKDIAEHLRIRLKKEKEEKETKKRYKAEAHLYTILKVARDADLVQQIGKDLYFDLIDYEKVHSFRVQKQMPFNMFKEEVAKELGIPVQFQRFWLWAKRQNQTYRPNRPLFSHEEMLTVGQLKEVSNKAQIAELKLFLEIEFGPNLNPLPLPEKTKDEILIFFKLYDPEKLELRYVGRSFVNIFVKVSEIIPKLKELAGFSPDEEIQLYEEIKFEPNLMCERLDTSASFRYCNLEDGDIICFQKLLHPHVVEKCRFPNVPSFFEYMKNRQIVHFRSLDRPKDDDFFLELSKSHTYDEVVERVADQLCLEDPSKIRLTSHNCYSQQPKPHPVKYRDPDYLLDMLVHYNQISDILYYEVLDIPLPELQCLKTLKIVFHHSPKEDPVIHNIRLPKQSTVGDVLNVLKTKVELSHQDAELRLMEVFVHKIYKVFLPSEKIENINDQYWTLRAEEIPEEEKNFGPQDRLIHVYHFNKDTNHMQVQHFGDPFFLKIHEDETLENVKNRIQKKLQVSDDEFSKWKFAYLSLGRIEYLEDTDIVSSRFQKKDVYGPWEHYLGLEHPDTTPKRSFQMDDVDPQPVPTSASGSKTPKPVAGDEIIALLPYLQFGEGTRELERFQRLRLLTPVSNITIDWGFLETVGVRDFTEDVIGANTPWRRLFDITHPGHREITLELYSTLAVRPRAAGQAEAQMLVPGADHEQAEVTFSLFGVTRHMSMEELGVALGLYTREEVTQPIYTQAVHNMAADELRVFWRQISDTVMSPTETSRPSSEIRDPLHRYLHKLIAGSIQGRNDGKNHCKLSDLFFLRCLLAGTPCNLVRCFTDYFTKYWHNQYRSGLLGGPYVTAIARYLQLDAEISELSIKPTPVAKMGLNRVNNMGIVGKRPDGGRFLKASQNAAVPFHRVPFVEAPIILQPEVDIVDQPVDDDQPDQPVDSDQDQDPPQHGRIIYRAVRSDPVTDRRLHNLEVGVQWIIDCLVAQHTGQPFDRPPPPRLGADRATTSGVRGREEDQDPTVRSVRRRTDDDSEQSDDMGGA